MEKDDEMMDTISDFRPEAVVVDAGTMPTNPLATRFLNECDRVVCCDGAADAFIASGRMPWRIVGDCDSLSPQVRDKYADIVRRVSEQESNDQTKAVRYLARKGVRSIVILGATGRREDHTLGNISLLMEYLKMGIDARIYTDYGVFLRCSGDSEFSCKPGTQVSIFNFGAKDMSSEGLRWPIRDFSSWWQGTLNEAETGVFSIKAKGEYLVFVNYL